MSRKTLILLCDSYPLSAGEFFIDDEMRVIAPKFNNVLIYTASSGSDENLNRFVPDNAEVVSFSRQKFEAGKLKSIFRIFTPMFIAEFFFALKKLPLKYWLSAFKIMYVDMHRATNLKKELVALCNAKNINMSDCVFYSYWHDYKALALALLRKQNSGYLCIARAHGGDIFFERFIPPYIPFKKYIVNHLTRTYSISQVGKTYLLSFAKNEVVKKIAVSRLGKKNERIPLLQKNNHEILIVSCSNLLNVKRLDKIIDLLAQLNINNLQWVHFGDGPLRKEMELLAARKLKNIQYEFKGVVENDQILNFYAEHYVDLFVNLSSSEGIPVSIMEALSAGIPVLATNVGGTSEIVNAQCGFLADEDATIDSLVQVVTAYLQSDKENQLALREGAYNYWNDNYEGDRNFNNFVNLLIDLS